MNIILQGKVIINIFNNNINTNFYKSITRDNAASNNTLLSAFKYYYDINGYIFEGDVPYLAYIFNLVV